jgi:hypothetical protein
MVSLVGQGAMMKTPNVGGGAVDQSTRVALEHPVFHRLGEPTFRLTETDAIPVMAVRQGDMDVALQLKSLQKEFRIEEDSPDGRMLALITAALDFVAAVHIGDELPPEVTSGDASWDPEPHHVEIAEARLKLRLVSWLSGGGGSEGLVDPEALIAMVEDPAIRPKVQAAFAKAVVELNVAGTHDVIMLVGKLAQELAYIEALRERLLRRALRMHGKLSTMVKTWRGHWTHGETLVHVDRLAGVGLKQMRLRFEDLDAQTADVMTALRDVQNQKAFIRSSRDWLYRSLLAWDPILREWDSDEERSGNETWQLVERTYKFLAPRFMSVQEWISAIRPKRIEKVEQRRMVW